MSNKSNFTRHSYFFVIVTLLFCLIYFLVSVDALPVGPTKTLAGSSSRTTATNASINESTGGGYIYTYTFVSTEQNKRWKAYVGNVSGTLVLDDSDGYSIYQWDLGVASGEVYATRNSSTVSWTDINCTWAAVGDKNDSSNRTIENRESSDMSHTRLDNITATFSNSTHPSFDVGQKSFPANYCWTVYPYVNSTSQNTLGQSKFPEMIMYDGTDYETDPGSVVYVGYIETDDDSYLWNSTADFQMLVPEIGSDSWSSSTAYYFYIELA